MYTLEDVKDPTKQKERREARYKQKLDYVQNYLVDSFNDKSSLGNNFKLFIRFGENDYYGRKLRRDKDLALAIACVLSAFITHVQSLGWRLKFTFKKEWWGIGDAYLKVEDLDK